jgi:hypothetical membrane protein
VYNAGRLEHASGVVYDVLALRRAGQILFIEAALFLIVLVLCAGIAREYGLPGHTLSRLGILPATAFLFNGSLIALGMLNFLAAYFFFRGGTRLFTALAFVLAGLGAAGAGAVNVAISNDVHTVFAAIGFLGHILIPFALTRSADGAMRLLSYVAGISSVAFLLVWVVALAGHTDESGQTGTGATQRMIVYPLALWIMVFGGYLVGSSKPTGSGQPSALEPGSDERRFSGSAVGGRGE